MTRLEAGEDGTLRMASSRAALVVDPADGGRIRELVVDGRDIIGASTPATGMPEGIFSGSFVMAPWVGRTAHGRFDFEGEAYEVPRNVGDHAMHGLVFDRPWRFDGEGITIDFDERWPFGGSVRQTFELGDDSLRVTVEISAGNRPMPAIVGFHPWFRERLSDGATAVFDFRPGTRYLCDDDGIPVGTIPGGGSRPWDDSFADVVQSPTITWTDGFEIRIETGGSHWIVCETMPDAFCIEPLSGPVNGLATGEYAVVAPGRPLIHSMTILWS